MIDLNLAKGPETQKCKNVKLTSELFLSEQVLYPLLIKSYPLPKKCFASGYNFQKVGILIRTHFQRNLYQYVNKTQNKIKAFRKAFPKFLRQKIFFEKHIWKNSFLVS